MTEPTGPKLVYDQNVEVQRILDMTEPELRAKMVAEGLDPDVEAAKAKVVIDKALATSERLERVKAYRAEHECSLQEAHRAILRHDLMAMVQAATTFEELKLALLAFIKTLPL